jgi:hypothetical protein
VKGKTALGGLGGTGRNKYVTYECALIGGTTAKGEGSAAAVVRMLKVILQDQHFDFLYVFQMCIICDKCVRFNLQCGRDLDNIYGSESGVPPP